MRKLINAQNHQKADQLRWYLESKGIRSWVDDEDPTDSNVWLTDEDQRQEASTLAEAFLAGEVSPADLAEARKTARITRQQKLKEEKIRKQNHSRRSSGGYESFPVTIALILICSAVFLLCKSGSQEIIYRKLLFSVFPYGQLSGLRPFEEILNGEIWRLVTPVLLHGNWFHLIFNLLWLWQFGPAAEQSLGSRKYLLLLLTAAAVSDSGFYLIAGPSFLGISGINYALCGWLWGIERYGTQQKHGISDQTFFFFLIWYVLCLPLSLSGLMRVANSIHGLGACWGIMAAFVASGSSRQLIRRLRFSRTFARELVAGILLLAAGILTDYIAY